MPFIMPMPSAPRCPRCEKAVYFAEKIIALGKDWHRACFKCSNSACNVSLAIGKECVHNNLPYCNRCHRAIFGPKGYGRGGGVESHVFLDGKIGGSKPEEAFANNNQVED